MWKWVPISQRISDFGVSILVTAEFRLSGAVCQFTNLQVVVQMP